MATHKIDGEDIEIGIMPIDKVAALSGLEVMEAIAAGDLPGPSIGRALNFRMLEVEEGKVVFSGSPTIDVLNPMGTVHGGWAATILDSALACAVHTTCPVGHASTSIDLKINFVRPIMPDSGRYFATGTIVHPGRQIATAEGRLIGEDGKLYAHASLAGSIFRFAR